MFQFGSMMRAGGALLVVGALALGCAGDNGDINYVQPGYVKKNELTGGSWYYRRTVVDAPETMGPYATIGTGDLFTIERIRWDVQEDFLIAYRDYDYVPGSESEEVDNGDYYGTPVAAFPISSHFDIKRRYSAATNEDTNVIDENTTDRPWYEREFMRVDWAKNEMLHLPGIIPMDALNMDGAPGGNEYVFEDDATNPYRARIEPGNGYVDFVVKHMVEADPYTCYDTFDFQMNPYGCGAGEVRFRHAFLREDPKLNAGYQPLYYPDSIPVKDENGVEIIDPATSEVKREPIFDRFGFYRLERLTYDNERDLTESGRIFRAIRFDIWQKSVDDSGAEIPFAQRQVRPIEYWLNADFPDDLKPAAREVEEQWNQVFQKTVASLQGLPRDNFVCPRLADGSKDSSDPDCALPDMFILHENSCSPTGLNAYLGSHRDVKKQVESAMGGKFDSMALEGKLMNWCAATEYYSKGESDRFVWQQNGDPRFNMMYWVPNIIQSGFSGYGPMLGDPVTGRIVSSTAYVMGWTIEDAATRALEYIDYINGEMSIEDVLQGSDLTWRGDLFAPGTAADMNIELSQSRMANRLPSSEFVTSLDARMQQLGNSPEALLKHIENGAHFDERLARVRGTYVAAEHLVRPEDLALASRGTWRPGMQVPSDLLEKAAYGLDMSRNRDKALKNTRFLQERTFCPMAELDGALSGLAEALKDKTRDERRNILRSAIFKAVMLHEVGHNLGLRHNFEASYDALNFQDQFWDIEGLGLNDEDKLMARQPEFKYSSIMDYHGKINADFQGLGRYDAAAIKFGYGQLIERFTDTSIQGGKALKEWRMANDYLSLPAHLGGADKMRAREDVRFDWTKFDLTAAEVAEVTANEVPYLFCSDEYAGYMPTCKRFDFGANQREMMDAQITRYKNYTIFTNYLRNRLAINWGAANRGYNVFADVLMTYQYWYLYRSLNPDFNNTPYGQDLIQAYVDGFNLMSEVLSMPEPGEYVRCVFDDGLPTERTVYYPDYMVGSMYDSNGDVYYSATGLGETCDFPDEEYYTPYTEDDLIIPVGPSAQPLFIGFTDDYTAWTFSYIGTYWDKESAVFALTNPYAYFFRVDGDVDYRTFSVSPYRLFDREILKLMDGIINYDLEGMGSVVVDADLDEARRPRQPIQPPKLFDASRSLPEVGVPAAPTGTVQLYPAFARNLQRFAVLYGNALLSSPLDATLDFSKHARVVLKGGQDDLPVFDDMLAGTPEEAAKVAECHLTDLGVTYRALATDDGYSIGFDMVNRCAQWVPKLTAARAAWHTALQDLADAQDAYDANTDSSQEQTLLDALNLARIHADRTETEHDITQSELASTEQALQFMRLVHLIYEHGATL